MPNSCAVAGSTLHADVCELEDAQWDMARVYLASPEGDHPSGIDRTLSVDGDSPLNPIAEADEMTLWIW